MPFTRSLTSATDIARARNEAAFACGHRRRSPFRRHCVVHFRTAPGNGEHAIQPGLSLHVAAQRALTPEEQRRRDTARHWARPDYTPDHVRDTAPFVALPIVRDEYGDSPFSDSSDPLGAYADELCAVSLFGKALGTCTRAQLEAMRLEAEVAVAAVDAVTGRAHTLAHAAARYLSALGDAWSRYVVMTDRGPPTPPTGLHVGPLWLARANDRYKSRPPLRVLGGQPGFEQLALQRFLS